MADDAQIPALFRRTLVMNDGAELSIVDVGSGPPLIILPSWTNSAIQYHSQLTAFAANRRVLAIDMRGSGLSAKIDYGLRVSRLSADLREVCDQLSLDRIILLGHSMGCAVIWSYLDLFGPGGIDALIFVDQPATHLIQPWWSKGEALSYGAVQTANDIVEFATGVAADGEDWTQTKYRPLFTKTFPREEFEWAVGESRRMPRKVAAALFLDHATRDWRDVITRIRVPTLIVAAEMSIFPAASQEWIARQIPGARLKFFAEKDGGSHFMCFENPDRFNAIVRDFLAGLGRGH